MGPNTLIEKTIRFTKRLIPQKWLGLLLPFYHESISLLSALVYRFPSKEIRVVAITGTKGKTTTSEMVNAILTQSGHKTALLNTYQIKVGEDTSRNMFKMSTPGRGFVQKFIRRAVRNKCDWVILELTSQAVLTARHKYIALDALIFTNISPEHIEAHGSFEAYLEAKLEIAYLLRKSSKESKVLVVNGDDSRGEDFVKEAKVPSLTYHLSDTEPYEANDKGSRFTYEGVLIQSKLPGVFNIYNMLGASVFATSQKISTPHIKKGLENISSIRGRLECINPGDSFEVYVDYAHTTDSLEKVYQAFEGRYIIAVLGNTGGGRDTWKRPKMAELAEKYCHDIVITNEDPYDEDPMTIMEDMYNAIEDKGKVQIIEDRRRAIRSALQRASTVSPQKQAVVLITGKGTDPYIMGPNGQKTPWDDAQVVREELSRLNS